MSYIVIANAVLVGDEKVLTLTNLGSFELIAPKDPDINAVKHYISSKNDPALLENPD